MKRGEIRWSDKDCGWEVVIPSIAFKNANSSFFGSKPFRLVLPDFRDLYKHIEDYVDIHRGVLFGGAQDPGTFFVKTVKASSRDAAYAKQHSMRPGGWSFSATTESLTRWVTPEALLSWQAPKRITCDGQPRYSDLAIETALTLGLVFGLRLGRPQSHAGMRTPEVRPVHHGYGIAKPSKTEI